MQYYGHLVGNQLSYVPTTVLLEGIRLEGIPHFGSGGCCKYNLLLIYSSLFPAFYCYLRAKFITNHPGPETWEWAWECDDRGCIVIYVASYLSLFAVQLFALLCTCIIQRYLYQKSLRLTRGPQTNF